MSKILVTGVTGGLGSAVVKFLLEKTAASNISVLVRDAAKVEDLKSKGVNIIVGDYNNYDSLVAAFSGIDKLYFVSGNDIANRIPQHENVVKAATQAGVKHVVYTSFQRKNETATSPIAFVAEGHLKTEEWLKASGLAYTILKHGLYTDLLPMFVGEQVLETGVIYQPAGDGKTAFAWREDMAEAGANVLTSEGHEHKIYDITGAKTYFYQDIANIISGISGKQIVYVSPSIEEFTKTLTEAGVPAQYIGLFAGFSGAIKDGEFDEVSSDLADLLGRTPLDVETFLKGVYGK